MINSVRFVHEFYQSPVKKTMQVICTVLTYEIYGAGKCHLNTISEIAGAVGVLGSAFFALSNSSNLWSGKTLMHAIIFVASSIGLCTSLFLKIHVRENEVNLAKAKCAQAKQQELFKALDKAKAERNDNNKSLKGLIDKSAESEEERHEKLKAIESYLNVLLESVNSLPGSTNKQLLISLRNQIDAKLPKEDSIQSALETSRIALASTKELLEATNKLIEVFQTPPKKSNPIDQFSPLEELYSVLIQIKAIKDESSKKARSELVKALTSTTTHPKRNPSKEHCLKLQAELSKILDVLTGDNLDNAKLALEGLGKIIDHLNSEQE